MFLHHKPSRGPTFGLKLSLKIKRFRGDFGVKIKFKNKNI
jgi:hypothetical protein